MNGSLAVCGTNVLVALYGIKQLFVFHLILKNRKKSRRVHIKLLTTITKTPPKWLSLLFFFFNSKHWKIRSQWAPTFPRGNNQLELSCSFQVGCAACPWQVFWSPSLSICSLNLTNPPHAITLLSPLRIWVFHLISPNFLSSYVKNWYPEVRMIQL